MTQPLALFSPVGILDKRILFCLLVFTLFTSGCISTGKKTAPLDPYQNGQQKRGTKRPAISMFPSMATTGAVKLSSKEAAQLAKKLTPASQGMRSWQEMDFALSQSLLHASKKNGQTIAISRGSLQVTYAELTRTLEHMRAILPKLDKNPHLLTNEFTWYRIGPDFGVTGYFEPTLEASRKKTAVYSYPLYKTPPDLRKKVPYHSRNSIDRKGALAGKGLEIAWVKSEAAAFFLHIQGSGRLLFEDGTVTHVLYANKNNQPYRPLGRIMRDEGLLTPDNISMQSIKEVLTKNPHRQAELLDKNPSYIFFREASKGPVGAMGRPLTPWVSTAIDRRVLAHGALTFMMLPLPDASGGMTKPFYCLTLPQDTGGAIKGNRIDLFCGPGEDAKHTAGYLDAKGAVYVLIRK